MQLMITLCLLVALCGCQAAPRVGAVWKSQRLQVVRAGDEAVFLQSRVTDIRSEGVFLPPEQQGEDYYVTWVGPGVERVQFEYRQVDRPDQIAMQQFAPGKTRSHVFEVVGAEHRNGGAVSGWRVSLWLGDKLLAEKKSSLW